MADLNTLSSEFLEQDSISVNTLRAYKTDLKCILSRFDSLSQLNNLNNLRLYRVFLINSYSSKTVARRWSSLRSFLFFCQERKYIVTNHILSLDTETDNAKRTLKQNLPEAQILEMICNSPQSVKDKAILWFLYSTGIRVSELLQHGIMKNLNLAANEFHLPNRVLFLNSQSKQYLEEYLTEKNNKYPINLSDYIFTTESNSPLTENYYYTIFTNQAKKVSIQTNLKDLRDSLVMRLIGAGAKPEDIVYLLGYKSVKSVEVFFSHPR